MRNGTEVTTSPGRGTGSKASLALLGLSLAVVFCALAVKQVQAVCVLFPCLECNVVSSGQINLVVMDRAAGRIQLVPNIRILGEAEDFALVVPTPSVPELDPVSDVIWNEASILTRAVNLGSRNDGIGCGESSLVVFDGSAEDDLDGGVTVINEIPVGSFQATIISSNDADSLAVWLEENEYLITPADAEKLEPLVEAGWVFTAMKLREEISMPPGGWNTNVHPVRFIYEADEFELPLPFLTINRAPSLPLTFFVVDDHRMSLPGFDTFYANDISMDEYRAIEARHPNLAAFLGPGRWLTRLMRTFRSDTPMDRMVTLVRSSDDAEFRLTRPQLGALGLGGLPAALLAMVGALQAARWWGRRRAGSRRSEASM